MLSCRKDRRPTPTIINLFKQGVDTQLLLVADFKGAMINVSIQSVDVETGRVKLYAPVFKGVTYGSRNPSQCAASPSPMGACELRGGDDR